ncbi:MAG TPA: glycosyltransferase [Chloroflexota bacterium]
MSAPISVVLTVLNEAGAIGGLLDDLLAQDTPADELLVVDGGSTDGTQAVVAGFEGVRLVVAPGANISAGRNRGISEARNDIVAVTDAGVRLGPDWLRAITAPLQKHEAEVVAGFFQPDPHDPFETAMGATVLPAVEDVDPATFLPSSRSLAFRKDVWRQVGGYPEWLDYCEDLIFDINIRRAAGVRLAFVPGAVAHFRPRSSLGALFRQYYRYARGDGKADLWRKRHALRYLTYAHLVATAACLLAPNARRRPKAVAYLSLSSLAGSAVYLWKPLLRLRAAANGASMADWLYMLALIPVIRLVGDVAKMAGYPAGWWWRLRNNPPEWRRP